MPVDHPDAPKYWMHESSDVLAPSVKKYLEGQELTVRDIRNLRAYLYQWVSSPAWLPSGMLEALRLRAAAIASRRDIDGVISAAVHLGMDPL